MVGAYLNSLGLPTRAVMYMTFAAPASMQWLTVDDAEKIGIDVKLLDLAPRRSPHLSMAETNCARWRGKSVPVWLREKGNDAPGSVRLGCCAL